MARAGPRPGGIWFWWSNPIPPRVLGKYLRPNNQCASLILISSNHLDDCLAVYTPLPPKFLPVSSLWPSPNPLEVTHPLPSFPSSILSSYILNILAVPMISSHNLYTYPGTLKHPTSIAMLQHWLIPPLIPHLHLHYKFLVWYFKLVWAHSQVPLGVK